MKKTYFTAPNDSFYRGCGKSDEYCRTAEFLLQDSYTQTVAVIANAITDYIFGK